MGHLSSPMKESKNPLISNHITALGKPAKISAPPAPTKLITPSHHGVPNMTTRMRFTTTWPSETTARRHSPIPPGKGCVTRPKSGKMRSGLHPSNPVFLFTLRLGREPLTRARRAADVLLAGLPLLLLPGGPGNPRAAKPHQRGGTNSLPRSFRLHHCGTPHLCQR